MQKKYFIRLLIVLLIISALINAFLFLYSLKIYRQYKKFQIDPSSSLKYHQLNANIVRKSNGLKRIVLFGDSRIFQWDPIPEIPGCEFINRGVPGETTSLAILRIESDVVQLKPDIVIVQIGGNDCNIIGTLPQMENYITANCKNNIDILTEKLRKNKIKAVILSVFPFGRVDLYRWPVWSERTKTTVGIVNENMQKHNSTDIKIIDCDRIFLDNGKMKKSYSIDMLHINKSGYARLNDFIMPVLDELINGTTHVD